MYSPGGHSHGLGPRYCCPSTTHGHASGCLGCTAFFCMHIVNLCTTSRKGGSLSDCPLLSTPLATFQPFLPPFQHSQQHFLHGDFRIVLSLTFSHPPLTTVLHSDFRFSCNYKRGIRSTTLSKCNGMESRWITSRRHYQSGLRCANMFHLCPYTSLGLHTPSMPHPFSCAHLCFFSHQLLMPQPFC